MGCRGDRCSIASQLTAPRSAIPRAIRSEVIATVGATPRAAAGPATTMPLRFLKQGSVVVRGPATGRQYAFETAAPVQEIDVRDAPSLLRTAWFRRV